MRALFQWLVLLLLFVGVASATSSDSIVQSGASVINEEQVDLLRGDSLNYRVTVNPDGTVVLSPQQATTADEKKVERKYGLEGVAAGNGWMVTITGLLTVFSALSAIALILSALPFFMGILAKYIPEPSVAAKKAPAKKAADNNAQLAVAIAAAIHKRKNG